jgi:hypothetical protein
MSWKGKPWNDLKKNYKGNRPGSHAAGSNAEMNTKVGDSF